MRLPPDDYAELDRRLAAHDAFLTARYPGERPGRQPVHTVYVAADRVTPDLVAVWRAEALARAARRAHRRLLKSTTVGK